MYYCKILAKRLGNIRNYPYLCTQKVHLIVSTFILHYKRNWYEDCLSRQSFIIIISVKNPRILPKMIYFLWSQIATAKSKKRQFSCILPIFSFTGSTQKVPFVYLAGFEWSSRWMERRTSWCRLVYQREADRSQQQWTPLISSVSSVDSLFLWGSNFHANNYYYI